MPYALVPLHHRTVTHHPIHSSLTSHVQIVTPLGLLGSLPKHHTSTSNSYIPFTYSAQKKHTKTTNSSGDHTHVHTAIRMRRLEATDGRIGVTWHDYRSPPPVLPQSCRTRVCRRLLFAPVSLCSTPIHVSGRLLISIPSKSDSCKPNRKFLEQLIICMNYIRNATRCSCSIDVESCIYM